MGTIILIRHGQSLWNLHNRFTGWVDVPLSPRGVEEALAAGRALQHFELTHVFTSTLERAIQTATLMLAGMDLQRTPYLVHPGASHWYEVPQELEPLMIPIYRDEALNERNYGDLKGMNKDEARARFGKEQVHRWRRSFRENPPDGESLADTAARTLPYYREKIEPIVRGGGTVLVAAHGNSLRALVMHLEELSEEEVLQLEIPTGEPRVYEVEGGGKLTRQPLLSRGDAQEKG